MTEDAVDNDRRHFLTIATAAVGVTGVGIAAVPFLSSLKPSARAQALGAPVEVPLSSIEPGQLVRVIWRGKLVYVLRRDEVMLRSSNNNRTTPPTRPARCGPNTWSSKVPAPTWVARRWRILRYARRKSGSAAFSAPVTAPNSISPAASTRACRRR